MRGLLIYLLLLLPWLAATQSTYLEAGNGIRVGIWQYNLGDNAQGDYAGQGLQYTHFSPFWPVYLQAGKSWKKWEAGLGASYTLFLDNEFRVHQTPDNFRPRIYAFTDQYVSLLHFYGHLHYYLVRTDGFRLGPCGSGGYFLPLNDYPEKEQLQNRWFMEGGIKGLFKWGKVWISVAPVYQWNLISGKESIASHQIFSFGGMLGVRGEW